MSSPHYLIICQTCEMALSPPSDRGKFWTAFEDFVIQYHRGQEHDCDKWMSETIYGGDDGKLYQEGGYGQDTVLIENWWRYGQINIPDTEWRNWPERSLKCHKYLLEKGLINRHGEEIKQPCTEQTK